MKTEQDLISGLNSLTRELHEKGLKLQDLNPTETRSAYGRMLKVEINRLQGQKRTLEHLLVVG